MAVGPGLDDVIASVQDLPVATVVTDLLTYQVVAANKKAADLSAPRSRN